MSARLGQLTFSRSGRCESARASLLSPVLLLPFGAGPHLRVIETASLPVPPNGLFRESEGRACA